MKSTIGGAAALFLAFPALAAPAPADLTAELRAKDQALLDAIAPGDKAAWDKVMTADAVYVDENGAILDRKTFLDQFGPLPANVSGKIEIADYRVSVDGDVAFVIHRDAEQEHYHGQDLTAAYLTTETWLKRPDGWKLAFVHAYAENRDPPAAAAAPSALDAYVGRYRAGPDLVYAITRDGDGLKGGVEGRPAKPILVESGDVMFVAGAPRVRKIFQRDAAGHITGFVDRREGGDLKWTRLP
jgi:ketosteroid isomerase-like protein